MLKKMLLAFTFASLAATLPALADTLSGTASFTDGTNYGTVTITATSSPNPGVYYITGISGTTNGVSIAGLLPGGTYPPPPPVGDQNDNLLFVPAQSGGYLDFYGLAYSLVNGTDVNLYYQAPPNFDPGYFAVVNGATPFTYVPDPTNPSGPEIQYFTPLTITPGGVGTAVTPEPESLALVGTGILGIAGILRRRFAMKS